MRQRATIHPDGLRWKTRLSLGEPFNTTLPPLTSPASICCRICSLVASKPNHGFPLGPALPGYSGTPFPTRIWASIEMYMFCPSMYMFCPAYWTLHECLVTLLTVTRVFASMALCEEMTTMAAL